MPQYMYVLHATRPEMLSRGPTPTEATILEDHVSYLRALAEQGVIYLYGRTQNSDPSAFGIVIFDADSDEEAHRIRRADPAVAKGVMTAELFPYRIAYMRDSG